MTTLVRVKLEDGSEVTVGAEYAESMKLKVLTDKRAVDNRGAALDPKPMVSVEEAGARNPLSEGAQDTRTPQQKAADTRAAKKAAAAAAAGSDPDSSDNQSGVETPEENQ